MHDLLLRETLTRAGLDPLRDVKLVRIDFFDMGQALSTGPLMPSSAASLSHDGEGGGLRADPQLSLLRRLYRTLNAGMLVREGRSRRTPAWSRIW